MREEIGELAQNKVAKCPVRWRSFGSQFEAEPRLSFFSTRLS
jgi:hypothetical protein